MQHYADKNDHADVMVVQESRKTSRRLAIASQPLVIGHQQRGNKHRSVVPRAQLRHVADEYQRQQQQKLQAAYDEQICVAKQDGSRLYADFEVIFTVDHGVIGVVDHCPDQCGAKYQPCKLRGFTGLRSKRHRYGPAECRAEKELRDGYESLDKRIDYGEAGGNCRQKLRRAIQHGGKTDGDQCQGDKQEKRFCRRNRAGSDRP